jgi:hypothetical protein
VHLLVATLAVAGFTTLWRAGHLHKRNEADSGSLALRLTRSLAGASTAGSLPTPPGRLPAERAIRKATSFQVAGSARLILTLQKRRLHWRLSEGQRLAWSTIVPSGAFMISRCMRTMRLPSQRAA